MLKHVVLFVVLAVGLTNAQSTAPYFGVWKYDPAKSDMGTTQITIAENAGEFTLTNVGAKRSYKFRMDGKSYTDPYGMNVVWTSKGERAWEATFTNNGKLVALERYTLSADGKSLTSSATVAGVSGTQDMAMTRTGGAGNGLAGTWSGKLQIPVFNMEIEPNGKDGLIYRVPGIFEVKATFDGKPYAMTGPLAEKGATAAFTHTGPRSFRTVQKTGERTTVDATATVADDGKTLTLSGVNEASAKVTWVFTRLK